MFCNKCGNEINENEKFCSKCGLKIDIDVKEDIKVLENSAGRNNLSKKIMIACIVTLVVSIGIALVLSISMNSNSKIISSDTVKEEQKEEKLEVIDKDTNELKINAQTLINAIIEVNNEIEEKERSIFKSPIKICGKSTEISPITKKEATSYVLGSQLSSVNSSYPYIIISDTESNNVYRISVYHPYLNGYGTEVNTTATLKNYKILYRALEKINQDELGRTIYDVQEYVASASTDIPGEFNIKGIHIGSEYGVTNKYGNKSGVYFIYGTK